MSSVTAIGKGATDIEAPARGGREQLAHVCEGVSKDALRLPGPDPMTEGMKLLNAIQDVYLDKRVTVA